MYEKEAVPSRDRVQDNAELPVLRIAGVCGFQNADSDRGSMPGCRTFSGRGGQLRRSAFMFVKFCVVL